ncbi:MAG TPA: MFS transporter [Nitrososphaerales archaeon]|nr:MFS transporter [Nitrososphaerales archaeon]
MASSRGTHTKAIEPQARRGIWTSVPTKVRLLILTQIPNSFAFGYFMIFVTSYLVQSGMSASLIGIFLTLEGAVAIVAGIPFAMLSDRRGRKWNVILGNVVFAPTILVFALTRNVTLLGVAAAVSGIGEAMALSSWNAMIADQTDLGNRDSAFSLSFIATSAAFSMGAVLPLFFPSVEAFTGGSIGEVHSLALMVLGALNFATPVILWALLRDYRERQRAGGAEGFHLKGMGLIMKFSLCNSIIGLGAGLIIPLLTTWLWLKFGVPDTYSGPYSALAGLTMAFAAVASPRLSKRIGLFPAILATQISSTVFMFSLAFISNVYVAGGVYLIRASLMNMNSPLMDSFLMGITPSEKRGLASTLNAIIWRLPNTGSTFVGGFLLSSAAFGIPALGLSNLDVPWVVATAFYVVGSALLYANFRNVKPSQ